MESNSLVRGNPPLHYTKSTIENLAYNNASVRVVSTISHEFRTPLAVINSNLQFLKTFRKTLSEEYLNDAFELCEEAVGNMSRILEDVNWLNNSNRGAVHVKYSALNLKYFFNHLLKEYSCEGDRNRIMYTSTILEDSIVVDKNLLRQVVLNVLSNALKYSQREVCFKVSQNIRRRELVINIEDAGIGILTNDIKHVFDPFFRGTNTKQICGTGLGLSVVSGCIKALKGEIKIDSIKDEGTKFLITIPYETKVSNIIN